jgi:hypothetical protein
MINELNGWHVASIMPPPVDITFNGKYRYQGWRPCIEWCVKQFGGGIGIEAWGPGWRFVGEGVFEFRDEKDKTWFILRWG